MASGVVQSHVEFVTESGVVSVVVTCQGVVEPEEWSGVRCRNVPESSGAKRNPLQRVEQSSGQCHDLPESLDLSAGARLGHLMERDGSLSHRSGRSSDVFEAANESTVVEYLRR